MKTAHHTKSVSTGSQTTETRGHSSRHSAAKILEHRYERRKIREQLRRLDWALNADE